MTDKKRKQSHFPVFFLVKKYMPKTMSTEYGKHFLMTSAKLMLTSHQNDLYEYYSSLDGLTPFTACCYFA